MTIDKIKYFLDLSKTLNYTETAENFFTTQGNISKQIKSLEQEMDVVLFSREHRYIILSPAGKAFIPIATKMLMNYQEMITTMIPFRKTANKTLRICTLPVMSHYHVTGLLSQFCTLHKDIFLDIKEMEMFQQQSSLDNGKFDIACTRLFSPCSENYETIAFDYDELAAVFPKNHPLAKKSLLQLSELEHEQFCQLDEHTTQFQIFTSACSSAGFHPKTAYSGARIDNILSFVAAGMGISLLMQQSVETLHYPGIVIVPLAEPIKSELAFLRLKKEKHSDTCDLFWNFLKHKFAL